MTRFNMFYANPYLPRVVEDVDPYGEIYIVVPSMDERAICNCDDLGRPHGKPASFLRKHCGRPYNQNNKYRTNL